MMITKIEDFLNSNNNFSFPEVPNGDANSIGDFYDKCIKQVLPQKPETLIAWHNLLSKYVDDEDAILLSRLYESKKLNGEWDTRRGMYTRMADGFQYAYATNFFARLIYTMSYFNFVPEYEDFKQMFTEKKISLFSFLGTTKVEKKYAAFNTPAYPARFYTQQWYLAHIVAVNDEAFKGYRNADITSIFTSGKREDWVLTPSGYYERYIKDSLNEVEKRIAKAHFLRFVDPLNYFLVPNSKRVSYKQIGEDYRIIDFMKRKYFEIFGSAYESFLFDVLVDSKSISEKSSNELAKMELPQIVFSSLVLNSSSTTGLAKKSKTLIKKENSEKKRTITISSIEDFPLFDKIESYRKGPCDKSFSESRFSFENEFMNVLAYTHSNKWLGEINNSEMEKMWSIIFEYKKSFDNLPNWKKICDKYNITISNVAKGKYKGCFGIRLRGMKSVPDDIIIRSILCFIFQK